MENHGGPQSLAPPYLRTLPNPELTLVDTWRTWEGLKGEMDAEMTKLLVTKAYPRSNGICKT